MNRGLRFSIIKLSSTNIVAEISTKLQLQRVVRTPHRKFHLTSPVHWGGDTYATCMKKQDEVLFINLVLCFEIP